MPAKTNDKTIDPDLTEQDSIESDEYEESIAGKKVKDAVNRVAKGFTVGAENVSTVVKRALQAREHVLMVRVNDETLARISDLKDAGLFRSRSEAAAYLIAEGIVAKQDLFDRIQTKIKKIQQIKDELRALADDTGGLPIPEDSSPGDNV
ncbi:MAG: hypothetical protein V2A56_10710 [bacterium]